MGRAKTASLDIGCWSTSDMPVMASEAAFYAFAVEMCGRETFTSLYEPLIEIERQRGASYEAEHARRAQFIRQCSAKFVAENEHRLTTEPHGYDFGDVKEAARQYAEQRWEADTPVNSRVRDLEALSALEARFRSIRSVSGQSLDERPANLNGAAYQGCEIGYQPIEEPNPAKLKAYTELLTRFQSA